VISVGDAPRELRAVAAVLRVVEPEIRREINTRTRTELGPVWQRGVAERARTSLDRAVLLPGTRIAAGNPPTAIAANSKRRLSGGLVPQDEWAPVEFGGNRAKATTYRRRNPSGSTTSVTRHTARQLKPRNSSGWVVFDALAELGPRLASLWAATVVRTVYDKFEQRG
jgi:hypothetical protein